MTFITVTAGDRETFERLTQEPAALAGIFEPYPYRPEHGRGTVTFPSVRTACRAVEAAGARARIGA